MKGFYLGQIQDWVLGSKIKVNLHVGAGGRHCLKVYDHLFGCKHWTHWPANVLKGVEAEHMHNFVLLFQTYPWLHVWVIGVLAVVFWTVITGTFAIGTASIDTG